MNKISEIKERHESGYWHECGIYEACDASKAMGEDIEYLLKANDELKNLLIRSQVECPDPECNNQGWHKRWLNDKDYEQEQCDHCCLLPNSVFSVKETLKELDG